MLPRFLVALAFALTAASGHAAEPISIRWSLTGTPEPGQLSLRITRRTDGGDRSTMTVPFADLTGWSPAQPAAAAPAPVKFRILREAGRLDCQGWVGKSQGSGDCGFTPDEVFASELARRGIGRPRPSEQLELAIQKVSLALVDELARQGYRLPTVSQLVGAGVFRIDAAWMRSLDAAGYRARTVGQLVAFRVFHIEPAWISEMASLGPAFRNLPAEQLVAMRIHRVTPEFGQRMLGEHPGLTPDQLVQLAIFGGRLPPGRARARAD